jgi:hypothetical protein
MKIPTQGRAREADVGRIAVAETEPSCALHRARLSRSPSSSSYPLLPPLRSPLRFHFPRPRQHSLLPPPPQHGRPRPRPRSPRSACCRRFRSLRGGVPLPLSLPPHPPACAPPGTDPADGFRSAGESGGAAESPPGPRRHRRSWPWTGRAEGTTPDPAAGSRSEGRTAAAGRCCRRARRRRSLPRLHFRRLRLRRVVGAVGGGWFGLPPLLLPPPLPPPPLPSLVRFHQTHFAAFCCKFGEAHA